MLLIVRASAAASALALALASSSSSARPLLRRDGVAVAFPPPGQLEREHQRLLRDGYPWRDFSAAYVKSALADPKNWTALGLVTPVKDQGPHGYCGTFGRVGAAEGQFAMRKGGPLTSFSEEELVDCIGWGASHSARSPPFFSDLRRRLAARTETAHPRAQELTRPRPRRHLFAPPRFFALPQTRISSRTSRRTAS